MDDASSSAFPCVAVTRMYSAAAGSTQLVVTSVRPPLFDVMLSVVSNPTLSGMDTGQFFTTPPAAVNVPSGRASVYGPGTGAPTSTMYANALLLPAPAPPMIASADVVPPGEASSMEGTPALDTPAPAWREASNNAPAPAPQAGTSAGVEYRRALTPCAAGGVTRSVTLPAPPLSDPVDPGELQ